MSSTQDYIEYVCDQIHMYKDVRYRKMFGDYMVYVNDIPVLLVCDNTVYVKKLSVLLSFMKNADTGIPYEGATEHYILDIDDTDIATKVIPILERNYISPKKNPPAPISSRRYEIIKNYLDEQKSINLNFEMKMKDMSQQVKPFSHEKSLTNVINEFDETFSDTLLRIIDEKHLEDVTVYKRALIDRKLFSKIRSTSDYQPSKITAIALAIALELSLDETNDLIGKAGFSLSPSSMFDMIIKYCLENEIYNMNEINLILSEFRQQKVMSTR